jgi:predicted CXXCH cytochrome family protein
MKRWTLRLALGLVGSLTLLLMATTVFAQSPQPPATQTPSCRDCHTTGEITLADGTAAEVNSQNCTACHAEIHVAWGKGAHSQGTTAPAFKAEWDKQGQPKACLACHTTGYDPATGTYKNDGITCAACHDPVSSNHPLSPATMSRSSQMCGNCHTDTYFEWQSSQHGKSDLTCVSCHDPHATSIKAASASELCSNCHGTRVSTFAHTNHAAQGLTCADCHLTQSGDTMGGGHGKRKHTYTVDLATCTKCHQADMHSPAGAMIVPANTPLPPDSMNSGGSATVTAEPTPVSPVGFAVFAGLIGLAGGIVLAPWLENGFRRFKGSGPRGGRALEVKP